MVNDLDADLQLSSPGPRDTRFGLTGKVQVRPGVLRASLRELALMFLPGTQALPTPETERRQRLLANVGLDVEVATTDDLVADSNEVRAQLGAQLRLTGTLATPGVLDDSVDIVAEYVFHPLETPRWRKQMTVQRFGIDHKITGSQIASTTEYSVSLDGGSTWSKYNQVRIPVSSGGAIDTDPIRVPLHQTAPRIAVKVKHTGLGGAAYFNMTGAEAEIVVRGKEVQGSNPTAVGSSL